MVTRKFPRITVSPRQLRRRATNPLFIYARSTCSVVMEAGRRRTTLAAYQQESQTGVPVVPMSMQQGKRVFSGGAVHQQQQHPFGRQSLMAGPSAGPSGGRFSMAVPQRAVSASHAGMRQSMVPSIMSSSQQQQQQQVPFASSSQEHHYGSSQQSSQQASQSLNVPGTVGRGSQMYNSNSSHHLGVASAARHDGYLRSSMSQAPQSAQSQQASQGYAPPR